MNQEQDQKQNAELKTPLIPPALGSVLRPLAVIGVRSILHVADMTKTALQLAREEFEDIVAEAHFERLKKDMDAEIKTGPDKETEQTARGEENTRGE